MRLLSALALTVAAVLALLFWSCETTNGIPEPLPGDGGIGMSPHPTPNDAFMPPGDIFLPSDTSFFPDAGILDAGNGLPDAF